MEENALTQDHVTLFEEVMGTGTQSMGLGMDWVTGLDADPPTADADPPSAGADMPFVDSFNQLE